MPVQVFLETREHLDLDDLGDELAGQMLGFCLPMWAMILPSTPEDVWQANMAVVGAELAKGSGTAIARPERRPTGDR